MQTNLGATSTHPQAEPSAPKPTLVTTTNNNNTTNNNSNTAATIPNNESNKGNNKEFGPHNNGDNKKDGSSQGNNNNTNHSQRVEKLQKKLDYINKNLDNNLDLKVFGIKDPREELRTNLKILEDELKEEGKKRIDPKISSKSLAGINKELLKLNQQISSINSLSKTFSQKAKVRPTSSGSSDRSTVRGLLNIHQSESFPSSSIFSEIQDFFNKLGDDDERKFLLSCFSVFPENAVVKRRILVYWGLGEGYSLSASDTPEKTPEEIVDKILWEFQEKGLIEPAIRKRQMQVKSYRMDPLVRSAVIKLSQDARLFDYDSKGNVLPQRYWTRTSGEDSISDPVVGVNLSFPSCQRMCLLKAEDEEEQEREQLLQKIPSSQKENLPTPNSSLNSGTNLEKLVTLFNVNEPFPDLELASLMKIKDKSVPQLKEPKAEDWLSKMKNAKVICLGSWPGSVKSHVEVENTEFFKGLTNCKSLRFLSLQGVSRIIELPESIGSLITLEILDLKECHNLEVLSEEIAKLKNLKYLDLSDCYLLARMPKGLSQLVELRVLKGFVISNPQRKGSAKLDDLKRLTNLRKLTINANSMHFPTEKDLPALQELAEKGALRNLTMAWGATLADQQRDANTEAQNGGNYGCWKIFKSAPKEQNLQTDKLSIKKLEKLDLQCFPNSTASWLTPDSLPDLKKLYIRGGNLATLDRISNWSNVEALRLKYLRELKMNWREMNDSFPKLKYLEKVKCPGITLCPCDQHGVWMKNPDQIEP